MCWALHHVTNMCHQDLWMGFLTFLSIPQMSRLGWQSLKTDQKVSFAAVMW